MQNIGNINYSLNKNDFYKVISGCTISLIPFYYIVVFISMFYLFRIRMQKYYFSYKKKEYRTDEDTLHYFKSITFNSPFKIVNLYEETKHDDIFIGLTSNSYLIIIICYIISLIFILEGLMRNLIYSFYANIIQLNSNNNPYNNINCITKINQNPNNEISANYSAISSLSINYLFPFLIALFIYIFKFDNYDIKHSDWFNYLILFLIFYPFLIIILSRATFFKKLQIFPDLNKYLDVNDGYFVKKIQEDFNFNISSFIIFIIIILIYCFYTIVYCDIRYEIKKRIIVYIIIGLIIFILLPIFILFFALSSVLNNKNITDTSELDIINNIRNNGLSGLYDLLVKYNYPCFVK